MQFHNCFAHSLCWERRQGPFLWLCPTTGVINYRILQEPLPMRCRKSTSVSWICDLFWWEDKCNRKMWFSIYLVLRLFGVAKRLDRRPAKVCVNFCNAKYGKTKFMLKEIWQYHPWDSLIPSWPVMFAGENRSECAQSIIMNWYTEHLIITCNHLTQSMVKSSWYVTHPSLSNANSPSCIVFLGVGVDQQALILGTGSALMTKRCTENWIIKTLWCLKNINIGWQWL